MQSRSRFVFAQLSQMTGLSEDWQQKLVDVLVRDNRFIHQKRRDLLASDLASLINCILMGKTAAALEADTALSEVVYKGSFPGGRTAVFTQRNWRELLIYLIENAPPLEELGEPATNKIKPGTLPNVIEVTTTVPYVSMIWLGPDGRVAQTDWFGPEERTTNAVAFARKTVIDGKVINVLADILRTPAANARPGTGRAERETAALGKAAAPTGSRDVTTTPLLTHTGEATDSLVVSQGRSVRAPGIFDHTRRHNERPHPRARSGG
jgi:hypothetical protein